MWLCPYVVMDVKSGGVVEMPMSDKKERVNAALLKPYTLPGRKVSGSFHQGTKHFDSATRGVQCTSMAMSAIATSFVKSVCEWTTHDFDSVWLHAPDSTPGTGKDDGASTTG
jgi:hypothetical protein